jgi:hypothetical protein
VKYSYTITLIQRCPTCRLPEALTEMSANAHITFVI